MDSTEDFKTQQIFKNPIEFSMYIEKMAVEHNQSCLTTLIDFLEDKDIEVEKIQSHLSQSLRDKLRQDFVDAGMISARTGLNDFLE